MKGLTINKDTLYSLHNVENYRTVLNETTNEVTQKYSILLTEYFKFITENIKQKNKKMSHFIITRGVDTITNVFVNILLYTKNIDLTYFHSQRSFYFYVEFVSQITEDEKTFLQLSSRDATTYVYKKTLYEISNDFKKLNESMTAETREKFEIINIFVKIYKIYIIKIVENYDIINNNFIKSFEEITNKLNNYTIKLDNLKVFENVVINLNNKIEDTHIFFEINQAIIKKFVKNNEIIYNYEKKIYAEDFTIKIEEQKEKCISWLTGSSLA
jgi:hypothetical protein